MMLPPREFEEGEQNYVQCVSAQPASRFDVITLQEHLDRRMAERKARESGICVVREQLYSQCFDELIRQVTLNLPERGLMLLRVRDEMKLTISASCYLIDIYFQYVGNVTNETENGKC